MAKYICFINPVIITRPDCVFKMDTDQRIEVVILMAKLESVTLVRRELQRQKWADIPHENTIRNLFNKFKSTGSVHDITKSGRSSMEHDKKGEIFTFFTENPITSLRDASSKLNCSHETVRKVLHDYKMFPYKMQVTQQLYEEDFALRVAMAETLLEKIENDTDFLDSIIFSDESTFRLDGTVNRHNCRIWGLEKPQETLVKCQASQKVNVWMGMSRKHVYGPFFFDGNINAENYLDMLKRCFMPIIKRRRVRNVVFQQDGAPAHYARAVRDFLDNQFPGKWLGRCGPLVWAARSPDLSPLDFFVWGYLKTKVFARKPTSIHQLKDFICDEASKITPDMCNNAISSFHNRLYVCIEKNGRNVEH